MIICGQRQDGRQRHDAGPAGGTLHAAVARLGNAGKENAPVVVVQQRLAFVEDAGAGGEVRLAEG